MKTYHKIYIALGATLMLATSCGKWLDITPEQITTEKDLFADYSGYWAALNGIYMEMADVELYGHNLSWGFATALGQYYNNSNPNKSMKLYNTEQYLFDTPEVRDIGENIWQRGYNVIANCNNLLQHIATVDVDFFLGDQNLYNAVKAEALAARAMMHFDLLRLYAASPLDDPQGKAIAYSKVYPDKVPPRLTTDKVIENVIADLKAADELFAFERAENYLELDGRGGGRLTANEKLLSARYSHINGVAVRALLARVYTYNNDLDKAFPYAEDVYETYLKTRTWWSFTNVNSINGATPEKKASKLGADMIFGLHYALLVDKYNEYTTSNYNKETGDYGYAIFNADYMFSVYRNDVDDYRYKYNLQPTESGSGQKEVLKYSKTSVPAENPIIPIIRMSEMCSIIAEYYCQKDNQVEAVKYLQELRVARGARERRLDGATMTKSQVMEELDYDFWKESIGEGQYFFRCKRLNAPVIKRGAAEIPMNRSKYVLPIPHSATSLL